VSAKNNEETADEKKPKVIVKSAKACTSMFTHVTGTAASALCDTQRAVVSVVKSDFYRQDCPHDNSRHLHYSEVDLEVSIPARMTRS